MLSSMSRRALVAGRGHDAVGIVALVEHQPLEDRLAVDLDRLAVDGEAAQPGVAARAVDHVASGVEQVDVQVVQVRVFDRPQPAALGGMGRSRRGTKSASAAHSAATTSPASSFRVARRRSPAACRVSGCSRRIMLLATSGVMRGRRRALGHGFQPDRLPDAGGADVDRASGAVFAGLLAARLRRAVIVARAHDDRDRLAGLGDTAQVAGEGRKAAAMAPDFHAVDPHGRIVIDRLEVQQHAPPGPVGRDRHLAPVPDGVRKSRFSMPDRRDSGQKGTWMRSAQVAFEQAALQAAVAWSISNCHSPFRHSQSSRANCGRGYSVRGRVMGSLSDGQVRHRSLIILWGTPMPSGNAARKPRTACCPPPAMTAPACRLHRAGPGRWWL